MDAYKFLKDKGLLFELNRTIFHPLGYTLKISGNNLNLVEDLEAKFSSENYKEGRKKFEKYMNEVGLKRMNDRFSTLGFTIQVEHSGSWAKDNTEEAKTKRKEKKIARKKLNS